MTIGSITSSHLPLIVGAYDGHDPARAAAPFSSRGPSRDLRPKPDLAAPGVAVLAARSAPVSASRNLGLLTRKSGTSMATPHVTGAVALCLQAAGTRLSARQIRSLVLGSCDPAPGPGRYRLGHGYLNIPRLMAGVQQALAAPASIRGAKEPTMDTEDIIALLAAAPATAYREYLYRPHGQFGRWIGDRFEVVARPGQRIGRAPQAGDVLLQVRLGRIHLGRCIVLGDRDHHLAATPPKLAPGQLLLRPRSRAALTEPLPVEPAAEIPYLALSPTAEPWAAWPAGDPTEAITPVTTLTSSRFAGDSDLDAVAKGTLRLAAPGTSPHPAPVLSQGPAIAKIQQALIDLGYPLPQHGADGQFGPEAGAEVTKYKTDRSITPNDPVIGRLTIASLDADITPLPTPPLPTPPPRPTPPLPTPPPRPTPTPTDYLHWFDTSPGMWPVRPNSRVSFFTTGEEAFQDIGERLELEAGPDTTALFLGWSFTKSLLMQPAASSPDLQTLEGLLRNFARQGGTVKAMLWKNTIMGPDEGGTADGVAFINSLPKAKAIHDKRTPLGGSHHQKVQALVRPEGAVAYCGGMDLFKDRIGPDAFHDVHCKVQGDASKDLVSVFSERWNDHPEHDRPYAPAIPSSPASFFTNLVQVCRTYPRFPGFPEAMGYWWFEEHILPAFSPIIKALGGYALGDMGQGSYSFYPSDQGVQQVWRAVQRAIDQARRFIYLEDQYLVNLQLGQALAEKLMTSGDDFRIVILVLHSDLTDIQQVGPRRRAFLHDLIETDPNRRRWQIFTRKLDQPHPFVHSKTWIFDDELVITGSANADRRGYTYNSEADVVVAGNASQGRQFVSGASTTAQDLRCRLFAKHLGGQPRDYLDYKKALAAWRAGRSPNVAVFNPNPKTDTPDKYLAALKAAATTNSTLKSALDILEKYKKADDLLWDYIEDPDSAVPVPTP